MALIPFEKGIQLGGGEAIVADSRYGRPIVEMVSANLAIKPIRKWW
jgi:hypothetical protein